MKTFRFVFFVIILTAVTSCGKTSSKTVPGQSPVSDPALQLSHYLADCSAVPNLPKGQAIIFDLSRPELIQASCLAVEGNAGQFLTSQLCELTDDPLQMIVGTVQDGNWSYHQVKSLRKAPFQVLQGWLAQIGSLDVKVLETDKQGNSGSSIGAISKSVRRHQLTLSYLARSPGSCPEVKTQIFVDHPFVYDLGVPVTFGEKLEAPDLYLGSLPLDCIAARPGSVLSEVQGDNGVTVTRYVGVYSRPAKFYSQNCSDRGEEIFLNLSAGLDWARSQR
jgi:hypothetical protein